MTDAQDRYASVRTLFDEQLTSGADVGASFCATVEGETVVDLWGGFADEARTRPWRSDTIVNVYSTAKTMTALTALLVADRGELDFDAPVARYWPEFAANGKDEVKVSHVMSHSSGLAGWREPISAEDLRDVEKVTALLAAQEPLWKPGTASGYHATTQGYLVAEVVRRITGRSLGTVFREEIAEPGEYPLLGRVRGLAGHHRHGCSHDVRLCHEQDVGYEHRRCAGAWPRDGHVGQLSPRLGLPIAPQQGYRPA